MVLTSRMALHSDFRSRSNSLGFGCDILRHSVCRSGSAFSLRQRHFVWHLPLFCLHLSAGRLGWIAYLWNRSPSRELTWWKRRPSLISAAARSRSACSHVAPLWDLPDRWSMMGGWTSAQLISSTKEFSLRSSSMTGSLVGMRSPSRSVPQRSRNDRESLPILCGSNTLGAFGAKREAGGPDTGSWELPTSRVKLRIRLTRFRSPRHGAQWAFEFVALAPDRHSAISQPRQGMIQ